MADVVLKYENIISYIEDELQIVWSDLKASADPSIKETISSIKNIEVADEQMFIKDEERVLDQKTLYITVKFGQGPINFGSTVAPVYLTCLGTANKVKPAQLLLGVFSSTWTTKNLRQNLIDPDTQESLEVPDALQVWNTPEVVSNFNVLDEDFRNLYRVTGNIIVGPEAVRLGTLSYMYQVTGGEEHWEDVPVLAFADGYRASMDPQPFGNTFGFAESEVNFSTYTFSISTYLLNNNLCRKMLQIRGFRHDHGHGILPANSIEPNDKLKIRLTFAGTPTNYSNIIDSHNNDTQAQAAEKEARNSFFGYFKVVDSQINQKIAELPTITITFTR